MWAFNLSREAAAEFAPEPNLAWISFREPEDILPGCAVELLDCPLRKAGLPTLDLAFWDVTQETKSHIWDEKTESFFEATLMPISDDQVMEIVKFIKANLGRNFVINCRAGISRSAAVAKFISEKFGYKWETMNPVRPNTYLYMKLHEYSNQ